MTDNEIIKALESLLDKMRAYEAQQASIGKGLVEDIISMYDRQKAEIEKKDTEIDILIRKKEALRDEISELTAEVERLSDGNHKCIYLSDDETTEYCVDGACSVYKNEAMIKSEAYREFAKLVNRRLNSNTPRGAYLYNIMKDVEKELTESKNDFKEV